MKIAIDTFGSEHGRSGFGSYILNFISNLPPDLFNLELKATTINADTKKNQKKESDSKKTPGIQIELFGEENDRYTYTSGKAISFAAPKISLSKKAEQRWHLRKINKFIKKNKYDAVIYPCVSKVFPVKFKKYTGIAIINSIISNDFEEMPFIQKKRLKKGLKNIQKIIAASEFIKNNLISLGISAEKITVIHNGIDHKIFFPMVNLDNDIIDIKPFSIKRPYFVYGSSLSCPEKKHIELINAFEIFKKNTKLPHRLVLAGEESKYSEKIRKAVFSSEFASDIFLVGFFPHESFAKLYAGAEACVFPSVNEGVGLPILEAMACGIPVLCSAEGALKEIGGSSPLYFDSNNIKQIADFMQEIVENKELRKNIVFDSILWANEFNWECTVKKTLALLQ